MFKIVNSLGERNTFYVEKFDDFMKLNFSEKERIHYFSGKSVKMPSNIFGNDYNINGKSLFIQTLHAAFDEHRPFSFSPDHIWYIICHEIATHVKQNSKKYRKLFTSSENKENMIVYANDFIYDKDNLYDNDWGRAINKFRDEINKKVPKDIQDLMLIDFSTSTDTTRLSILSIFMDSIQNYYTFTVKTRCGIPSFLVTGNITDWKKIVDRAEHLRVLFPDLNDYFDNLIITLKVLIEKFCASNNIRDRGFWSSIYKELNMSGSDLVTGWIQHFFAYEYSEKIPKLKTNFESYDFESFPTHISKIPFIWDYYGEKINMNLVSGFLGNDVIDNYMTPELGFGIIEIINQ